MLYLFSTIFEMDPETVAYISHTHAHIHTYTLELVRLTWGEWPYTTWTTGLRLCPCLFLRVWVAHMRASLYNLFLPYRPHFPVLHPLLKGSVSFDLQVFPAFLITKVICVFLCLYSFHNKGTVLLMPRRFKCTFHWRFRAFCITKLHVMFVHSISAVSNGFTLLSMSQCSLVVFRKLTDVLSTQLFPVWSAMSCMDLGYIMWEAILERTKTKTNLGNLGKCLSTAKRKY